jgi:UDP-2,3-diacylglucosamine pyrophosphatase LpxH
MHFRTIFISDVHLGAYGAKTEELANFLSENTCDVLYLVGDIIDFWKLKRSNFFPQEHVKIIQMILAMAENGTRVVYVPGNHDEILRNYLPMQFGNILLVDEAVHTTADGKKILIIHGDQFDQIMINAKWLMKLGDIGYEMLMRSNNLVHRIRTLFGYEYWSLSAYLKAKAKGAVNFIGRYETIVIQAVQSRGVDGVICGHIHHAEIREIGCFTYINSGDWVESCTAITEDYDGKLSIKTYYEMSAEVSGTIIFMKAA